MYLNEVDENIWTYEGNTVNFHGFPYSTRMTVIKLRNSHLWIHSPGKLNQVLKEQLSGLGTVKYLIAPNKLHHLFLPEWISEYPDAKCYAAPGLIKKRPDIEFEKELSNSAVKEWQDEIEQIIFQGSPFMEEAVFFHVSSKTLILTDLIENFSPSAFNWWQKPIAWLTGIISPNGKTPIDWRLSFVFGKAKARVALDKMVAWKPTNIIISHGECLFGNGLEFLKQSFEWLNKDITTT
jgi:hypothetical protein